MEWRGGWQWNKEEESCFDGGIVSFTGAFDLPRNAVLGGGQIYKLLSQVKFAPLLRKTVRVPVNPE